MNVIDVNQVRFVTETYFVSLSSKYHYTSLYRSKKQEGRGSKKEGTTEEVSKIGCRFMHYDIAFIRPISIQVLFV